MFTWGAIGVIGGTTIMGLDFVADDKDVIPTHFDRVDFGLWT